MKYGARTILGLVPALLLVLPGCGGDSASPSPRPSPVTISITETNVTLGAGEAHQFTANVTGTSNTAVKWSVSGSSGSSCGSINSAGYYTAPESFPDAFTSEVIATSQADPTKSSMAFVFHEPVSVSLTPTAAWISPGQSQKFTAAVHHDVQQMGVTWSVTCSGTSCGTLIDQTQTSVVYTAPAEISGTMIAMLKATSIKDTTHSASGNISLRVLSSPTLLNGDYAFVLDGWDTRCPPSGCDGIRTVVAGQFHADGNGHIPSGVEDIHVESASNETVAITGSYELEEDLRGTLTLTSTKGTSTYRVSIAASGRQGNLITFHAGAVDGWILGSGFFEKQDPNAFVLSSVAGPYALGLFGDGNRAAVGRFEANSAGVLSNGRMDLQRDKGGFNGGYTANYNVSGSLSAPSPRTGRGTAALNFVSTESPATGTLKFIYYVVSADKLLVAGLDSPVPEISAAAPLLSGEARRQDAPFSVTSLDGRSIFNMIGLIPDFGYSYPSVNIGQLTADGRGSFSGVLDRTLNSLADDSGALNQAFTGTYSVDPDGRAVLTNIPSLLSTSKIAYLFGRNKAFLIDVDGESPGFGRIEPQDDGPFAESTVVGRLVAGTVRQVSNDQSKTAGWITFEEGGEAAVALDDVSLGFSGDEILAFMGTSYMRGKYTLGSNGRGTLNLCADQDPACALPFWAISPTHIVTMGNFEFVQVPE